LYWDIDGTLLTTARAGVPALEDGAESVLGGRPDLSGMRTAGLTDRMIARQILLDAGHPPDDVVELRLLREYAAALPARLHAGGGRVLPGVRETLAQVAEDASVVNVLVTGNIRAGAMAKLHHYGLADSFEHGGFAEDGFLRTDIARTAVRLAEARYGAAALSGILLGDTAYDVLAGHEMGLRVIAVASDPIGRAKLAATEPWWVVDQVPSLDEIRRRMGVTAGAAGTT
jgi:phosphoglycolate phosphatase-like HAD superfamily hydrolase